MNRRRHLFTLLGGAFLALALSGNSPARAEVTTNTTVPIEPFFVFVGCANGGAGEVVSFTGPLHILETFTIDADGGVHGSFHYQPQGVTGVGEVTGDIYHATGVTRGNFNTTVGTENTYVNNFRLIGPGPGNNFLVHDVVHQTINANGTLTASVDQHSVECK